MMPFHEFQGARRLLWIAEERQRYADRLDAPYKEDHTRRKICHYTDRPSDARRPARQGCGKYLLQLPLGRVFGSAIAIYYSLYLIPPIRSSERLDS